VKSRFGFPILNRFLQPLGIRWKISGKDRLLNDSACIIVCNHQSGLDFILPLELAPDVTPALVAKRSILYLFPFGPAAWLCGGIFINRGKGQQCRTAISTTAKELHKKKVRLNEEIFSDGDGSLSVRILGFVHFIHTFSFR
jgi:lysophosphatidate acyltransferase